MNYLIGFKAFESATILDKDIEKYFPKCLTIVTDRGEFTFKKSNLTREVDIIRVVYDQKVWGEADNLGIDLHFVREKGGLKILVDVTFGDFMASEFSLFGKNKVNVVHYNGKGSKQDPNTHFGFRNDSLQQLIDLFNKFGFELNIDQFKFIDQYPGDFKPEDQTTKIPRIN